ncbi:ABC transporter permease [Streptomyces sp. NPDC021356]|uniref:ABC transporter permease n=1 Tax=Streptomyces sp. NPDC021356 TaxID=3154900 RepID=UPI0033D74D9C
MTTSMPTTAGPSVRASGGGLPGAVAAEWIKLWSVRSTWWCLLGGAGLMLLTTPIIGATMANNKEKGHTVPVDEVAVSTVYVAQFALIALAMLMVTSEYTSGSIRTTLQSVPMRGRLLAAKTAVAGVVSLLAGIVFGLIGVGVATLSLGDKAESAGAGALGSALRIGVYLALIAVLTMAVAVGLRSAAGTLTIVFVGLTVMPLVLQASDIDPLVSLAERMPNSAGTVFMNASTTPYGPGAGLLLLVLWALAAQAAGYYALRRRDA